VGNAVGDVAGLALLQRSIPDHRLTDGCLDWLDASTFVPVVTGQWGSWTAASEVVDAHLARARPVGGGAARPTLATFPGLHPVVQEVGDGH